jgi:hypothetical protein
MAKKDSQKKFKSFLKHITKYLDDEGIEHNVTVKREPDDPDDMNKVTKSVSIVFYKNTQPLANLHCYCTINDTITPYYTSMNYRGCVTRSESKIMRDHMPDIEANTLSIACVGVSEEERGKGYGLLILIYCICHINAENIFHYFNLDDVSNAANSVGKNIYRRVGFIPLPREFIELNLDNPKMYESTGGPELFVPLQCYEGYEYEDMIGRLVLKKFPLQDKDIELKPLEEKELKLLDDFVKKTLSLNSRWTTLLKASHKFKAPLRAHLSMLRGHSSMRVGTSMRSINGTPTTTSVKTRRTTIHKPYGGSGSAAKYTLKELKDIAVSNKIKITKKIDNKTLYLNKADLIKKLKKHGYYTICGLEKKEREINCGHSSPMKRPIICDRAAKYTLKELKDIAVSNKIKITKKIDNKTLYLNKADLIKKLKKHKLL